jgi:hypothetical protein
MDQTSAADADAFDAGEIVSTADTGLSRVLELLGQARALASQKNFLEAERVCLDASELAKQQVGDESPIYGLCLEDLGAIRFCQGKIRPADVTLTTALTILEKALGRDHADVARVFSRLHELYNS